MRRMDVYRWFSASLFVPMWLALAIQSYSYEVETHALITKNAFNQALNTKDFLSPIGYLSGDILTKGADTFDPISWTREWAMEGSRNEDETFASDAGGESFRYLHHFYDPVSDRGLDINLAFVGVPYYHVTGHKAPDWALEDNGTTYSTQFYSIQHAKAYYYAGLTANTSAEREANLAKTFRSLGQVMHVLEDMAQPQHTRNDPHGGDVLSTQYGQQLFGTKSQYELYVDHNRDAFNYTAAYPVSFDSTRKFYITDDGKGMANFSNRSFVTAGTNIKCSQVNVLDCQGAIGGGYPSPVLNVSMKKEIPLNQLPGIISNSTDIVTFFGNDITDNYSGQSIHNDFMTTYSIFDRDLKNRDKAPVFTLNRFNYAAMAQILLPRAVGYSAGLLNYFFRGTIEISLPNSGVYSSMTDTATGFSQLNLLAKNTTPNSEEMTDGSIELVVKYRLSEQDPFHSIPGLTSNEFFYKVVAEKNDVRTIPTDSVVELSFDLSGDNEIPLWATDVYLQVVYHGKLGNEDGAVAVGFKDISEPTPIDEFNNMDKICIKGVWYSAGSVEAYNALPVSAKNWDYWAHDLKNEYMKISPTDSPADASPTSYTFYKSLIGAGTLYRSYILSDYNLTYSGYGVMEAKDPNDHNIHSAAIKKLTAQGTGVRNQEETINDQDYCATYELTAPCIVRITSWFYPFRGVDIWGSGGFITDGLSYPNITDPNFIPCSWSDLAQ